jgi:hypothetical protein
MSVTATHTPAAESTEMPCRDEFIAGVLQRAHRTAHAHAAPDEARVILGLAQLFADELARTHVRFDRLRFVHAVTGGAHEHA